MIRTASTCGERLRSIGIEQSTPVLRRVQYTDDADTAGHRLIEDQKLRKSRDAPFSHFGHARVGASQRRTEVWGLRDHAEAMPGRLYELRGTFDASLCEKTVAMPIEIAPGLGANANYALPQPPAARRLRSSQSASVHSVSSLSSPSSSYASSLSCARALASASIKAAT